MTFQALTDIAEIDDLWYSMCLSDIGHIVSNLDDINQCIGIIVTTKKGDDPHRPDFGTNIWMYIDRPVNMVSPHIIRECAENLQKYEPRITLVDVSIDLPEVLSGHNLVVTITYNLKNQYSNYQTRIFI